MNAPSDGVPLGLKDSVLFHLEAALRIINARAELLAQDRLGLCVRECLIIQAANSAPPLSQGYIADCLGVNRNVMVLEVDRLEEAGYLQRERRRANRREATIVLTPKGRRVAAAILKLRAEPGLLQPTTAAQRAALLAWARVVIGQAGPPVSSKAKPKKIR